MLDIMSLEAILKTRKDVIRFVPVMGSRSRNENGSFVHILLYIHLMVLRRKKF